MSTYAEHEVLDLTTMTWSKGPDLPTKRHGLASAVVDGRWYVIGGGRAAGLSVSDIVEIYTP
jgi:N-acetylneuraminic acid mutarotase